VSTLFGVPPPPEHNIFEPGYGPAGPAGDTEVRYLPEPDPWRRRGAILLALCTMTALLFANLATWAHFHAVSPTSVSRTVSAPTLRDAKPQIVALLDAAILRQLSNGSTAVTPTSTDPTATPSASAADSTLSRRVDAAVRSAVEQPSFTSSWSDAIRATLARQREIGRGAKPDVAEADGASLVVVTTPLSAPIAASLTKAGVSITPNTTIVLPSFVVATTASTAQYRTPYRLADSLWWLLVLLTIGLAVATLWVAPQRLRMGVVMCIDAAVVLAGSLLLVPAVGQTVDDQAIDSNQSALLVDAYNALTKSLVVQTVTLIVLAVLTACGLGIVAWGRRRAKAREAAA